MSQIKVDSIVPRGGLPSGANGGIIQIVSTTKTDVFSTASLTLVDITGLSVTITPASSSSKILLFSSLDYGNNGGQTCRICFFRGSTNIFGDDVSNRLRGFQMSRWGYGSLGDSRAVHILDSPNTTSAVTYQAKMAVQASTGYLNRSGNDDDNTTFGYRAASSITVMEVTA